MTVNWQMDGRTDRRTDTPPDRDGGPHLKYITAGRYARRASVWAEEGRGLTKWQSGRRCCTDKHVFDLFPEWMNVIWDR